MSLETHKPLEQTADGGPPSRWRSLVLFLSVFLAVTALVGAAMTVFLRSIVSDSATTRATLAQAEQTANSAPPGDTPQQLEEWFSKVASRSEIPELTTVGFARQHKNGVFYWEPASQPDGKEWSESDRTPCKLPAAAEDAGLKKEAVHSFFEIRYPASDVTSNGYDVVAIYFFFDAEDRLTKHWVAVLRTDVHV